MNSKLRICAGSAVAWNSFVSVLLLFMGYAYAEFTPPRVVAIMHSEYRGEGIGSPPLYGINMGLESNITTGDTLKLYREKKVLAHINSVRIYIGNLIITDSDVGLAMGIFEPKKTAIDGPLIRHKKPMKGDFVIPVLTISSNVLFTPGSAELRGGTLGANNETRQSFQKIADFLQFYNPYKLIIEGHTDSDGEKVLNLDLSQRRAEAVRQALIADHDFIDDGLLDAVGYGESRPIADNVNEEGKAQNRRIEIVVVWENVEQVPVENLDAGSE